MLKTTLALAATLILPVAAQAAPVPGTTCNVLPADNIWNTDISSLPVHARSASWLASMSAGTAKLHPDFGAPPYGMPFAVVPSTHPKVAVTFDYADESDPGPYPFGADIPLEGGGAGDSHAFMIDSGTCTLYELYAASWNGGAPTAGSGAIFSLNSDALRPDGWTSADAAGLPIFPGLVRWDEVQAGAIRHAIRFTAVRSDRSYLWPARHQAGAASDPTLPPMGARFRLKAGFDTSGFSANARVILTAMQHYGLILADNGSNWYFQGTEDAAWPDALISELKTVPASAFEAVDESSLQVSPDSGQARATSAGPAGSVSPAALAFGSVVVGQSSATQTVTLTSTGGAALAVGTVAATGAGFALAGDGCSGATLAPGATCTVGVRFAPATAGASAGSVSFPGPALQVALTGSGTSATPVATVTPTSLAWGTVRIGNTSAAKTVTVKNTGGGSLVVSGVALAGTRPGDYVITANGCSTVAAGASCTIQVAFRPTATGSRPAELDISDNAAASPQRVTLGGTGRRH